ncbi:helix-turn-helix transcriptional regulator [Acidovorax sp. ACV02]|uniref:helix-turn-helix domain-containing protein n=1 Tax=Acidovorax sp. ACV02 TaxID=2769310 RepID=UPI00177E9A29|nr:AraC family transcriptional regulator [Acidovorax sp. ACV02]MBD9408400.1 helix-turn-helix transcriptional regulator [Acidovorax sp. ACV02]
MADIPRERFQINPHGERSLLTPELASQWRGFALGWVEAAHEVEARHAEVGMTTLAMLDCGHAQAEFSSGRKSSHCDLKPGAMGLFVQGTSINRLRWECRDVRRIMVEVHLAALPELGMDAPSRRPPWQTEFEFHDDGLAAVLRMMATEVANGSPNGQLYAQSLSLGVAMRLQQRTASRGSLRAERGRLSAMQVQRLDEWIHTRLDQDISLPQLAELVGFSPAHFVRLFRNTVGYAPYHYVLRSRLAWARKLLLTSDLPIAAIAAETGFSSQSHLTTAFIREYETPPGQMRRQEAGIAYATLSGVDCGDEDGRAQDC